VAGEAMIVIGLTGGIGMGKSTAAEFWRGQGLPVVDTDEVAREVVAPGAPAWEEIRAVFGPEYVRADGTLDRSALAERVFRDSAARRSLEAITHPRIRERWRAWMEQRQRDGLEQAVVVIPLLFETGAERDVDVTVCVACLAVTQRERLRQRGWTDTQIDQRVAAQWSIEEKMRRSDYVVWNEGPIACAHVQLNRILRSIAARAAHAKPPADPPPAGGASR
jgi:dephospho-CoA kinase